MKSFFIAAGILITLSAAYIVSFRINHRNKQKNTSCTGTGCDGCHGCPMGKEQEK